MWQALQVGGLISFPETGIRGTAPQAFPPYPTHTHIDSGLLMCNSPTAPCTERLSGMGTRSGSRVLGPDEGGPQAPGCGKALLQSRPHMQRCQATLARTAGLDGL